MKRAATVLMAVTALCASGPEGAGAVDAESPVPESKRLVAPFLTVSFLTATVSALERQRIESERLDRTYLQEETGLVWNRADNGTDVDWYEADEYCGGLELGGWADWRLPTLTELEGLHDKRSTQTYKLPRAVRLTACCPWSSSRSGPGSAWNFSFRFRKPFSGSLNYSYELRALCVRAASADDLEFFTAAAEQEAS